MGQSHTSHEGKASLIWNTYKERLGISECTQMQFDLDALIDSTQDMDWLEEQFTLEEIDSIIANLPSHKSPGFDGFNSTSWRNASR
jgi:hypothetical protein